MHVWIIERCKGRKKLAAFLTTAAILLSVLVPLASLFVLAAFEAQDFLKTANKASVVKYIGDTREKLNLTLPGIATDIKAVEYQLDNISETDRLEDIRTMGWQLNSMAPYHDDIAEQLPAADNDINSAWSSYLEAFAKLQAIQQKIDPTSDSEDAENEIRDPALLHHDFQEQFMLARDKFDEFKLAAMGGSRFDLWLRELANPSLDQVEEYGSGIKDFARSFLVDLGTSTSSLLFRVLIGGFIMIISLYFFLLDGPAMLKSLKDLSPINDNHEQELIDEFGKVSRAVVVATLLAALVQGLLGGIGYYFAGLDSVFLLTVLTCCLALVPFLGAAAVWVPCALWLYFIDNNTAAAIGLAAYGLIVVSMSDNLIKPLVLHGQSNLHPLFALLSILGGVAALGPIGILIGPMVVAFLQTLLKILQRELATLDVAADNAPTANN